MGKVLKPSENRLGKRGGFIFSMESFCEKYKLPIWAAAAAVLLGLPLLGLSQYLIRIFIMIGIYSMLALGLNLLTGYTGQVSLGHAGFFAIGAYVSSNVHQPGMQLYHFVYCGRAYHGAVRLSSGASDHAPFRQLSHHRNAWLRRDC